MIGLSMTTGYGSGSGATLTPPQNLSIVTTSLPDGTVSSAYSQTIEATGVVAPFTMLGRELGKRLGFIWCILPVGRK